MPSLRLARLAKLNVLRSIDPNRLQELFEPYAEYFHTQQIDLLRLHDQTAETLQRIVDVLVNPENAPDELLDALCLIDEMSLPQCSEMLLDQLQLEDLALSRSGKHSPADIAVAAWLRQRDLLITAHGRCRVKRARSYDYFQNSFAKVPSFAMPTAETLSALERDLDDWFDLKACGRGTRVNIYPNEIDVEISLRHGSLFRREECIDNGHFDTVAYRPVQADTVIFHRQQGELRINAKSHREKLLYCRLIGKHLFGDENCFPTGEKYSLEPLREYGPESVIVGTLDGIHSVRLVSLTMQDRKHQSAYTIYKANDLFEWFEAEGKRIADHRRLVEATFRIKLLGVRSEKSVCVRPPNVAVYSRSRGVELVESWLEERGYIVGRNRTLGRKRHESVLANV